MYDSHSHLTIEPIYSNLDHILRKYIEDKGKKILNVSSDPESISLVLSIYNEYSNRFPNLILNGLGIHPEYYSEINEEIDIWKKYNQEITNLKEKIDKYRHIIHCIGETGLDYYHLEHTHHTLNTKQELEEIQRNSFKEHLELAIKYNLPLSIHCRDIQGEDRAVEDTLNIVSSVGKGNVTGSFHSYTGNEKYIEDILNLGFYIGFNAIITYPKAENVREILRKTPLDRILIETDAPLLPPQGVRKNKKSEYRYAIPSHVREVIQKIAEIKNIPETEVERITDTNFEKLFLLN